MFITTEDYKIVLAQSALQIIDQADSENRAHAEKCAMEEISGYLRPRYDVEKAFSMEGSLRNSQLVLVAVDISLYNLFSSLNAKMGMDIRKERYDRALLWLEGVQKGRIVPDLPLAVTPDGESATPIHTGSERPHKNTW